MTDNAPLRGSKGMLYEGGIRVPLAVRWTGRIAAGSRCAIPVSGVDFFETFRVMLDRPVPAGQSLDGADLMPVWTGQARTLDRPSLYWHFPAYLQGQNFPGAADDRFRTRPCAAIRRGDWKLIEFFEDQHRELYNLADDIGETRNLAEQLPARAQQLADDLHAWQQRINAPIPVEPNPQFDPG